MATQRPGYLRIRCWTLIGLRLKQNDEAMRSTEKKATARRMPD